MSVQDNTDQGDKLSGSRRKLREATFFLHELEQRTAAMPAAGDEQFIYYLSAFLCAARSVTGWLEKEAPAAFESVTRPWERQETQDDRLFTYMRDQRDMEVHGTEGAKVESGTKEIAVFDVYEDEFGRYEVVSPTLTSNWIQEAPARIRKPTLLFRIDGEDQEVIEVCRRFVALLGDFVESVQAAAEK